MGTETEFVCPRPRNTRACDKCRARKTRCLPQKKPSEAAACQRCAKLGYTCTFDTATLQPTRLVPDLIPGRNTSSSNINSKVQPAQDQSKATSQSSSDDVISSLFDDTPKQTDDSNQLFDFHHRVFQDQLSGHPPTALGQTARQCPFFNNSDTTGSTNIGMPEAEKLVSLFRLREQYFPFVNVPDTVSARWLAKHKPFLLLAILTVTMGATPQLQRRTDERFRRVLSERVILHGEKSLDYVQGLLVYVAWYPFHLRPLRNQASQYMQIANAMTSDLKLAQGTHGQEGRDAYLACYNLSSLPFFISLRPGGRGAAEDFDLALCMPVNCEDTKVQFTKLQLLYESIYKHVPAPESLEDCFQYSQKVMKSYYRQLEILESSFLPHAQQSISNWLSRLFLRVSIAFLPLKPHQPRLSQRFPVPPLLSALPNNISPVAVCFSEIQTFLEALLSTPVDQYVHFSTKEWCQVILTLSMGSRICFSSLTNDNSPSPEWNEFQAKAKAKMLIYLESLAHRMASLSPSPTQPDSFCLFKSVLEILIPTYAPPTGTAPDTRERSDPSEAQSQPQQTHKHTGTQNASASASRCPVLNGSIQQTDFWRAFEQDTPAVSANLQAEDIFDQTTVDDVLNAPADWPSLFSEWVVDFNSVSL